MKVQMFVLERLAGVTSLLLASLCMLGQGAESPESCGVDARPHPQGICGAMLVRARINLCFLLKNDYPEFFGKRKRSVREIFTYPVGAFARMDLLGNDESVNMTEEPLQPPTPESDSHLYLPFLSSMARPHAAVPPTANDPTVDAVVSRLTGKAKQILAKQQLAHKRSRASDLHPIEKRGMACDCCFNHCVPSVLARYCDRD